MNRINSLQNTEKKCRGIRVRAVLAMLAVTACFLMSACSALQESSGSGKKPESSRKETSSSASSGKEESVESTSQTSKEEPAGSFPEEQAGADVPKSVIDPALTGKWGLHNKETDVDLVWEFKADGTGSYYANGYELPIASYVATKTPFTQYPEDGCLITVYWAEITETFGNTTTTTSMDPTEYGYLFVDGTLRIVYSRDIADHYFDFTRE